jgi:hypothetical protein
MAAIVKETQIITQLMDKMLPYIRFSVPEIMNNEDGIGACTH